MEFLQLMANSCVKSCLTTITFLLVIVNHTHVGNCQSLCLTGTYLGTLRDGSKDCLFCRENCGFGYEKVEDCTAESDIKCRKCSNGTFYDEQGMTCKNCTICAYHNEMIENCTSSKDTVCKKNTSINAGDEVDGNGSIFLVVAVVACVSITVIIVIAFTCWYKHQRKNSDLSSESAEMTSEPRTRLDDGVNVSLLNGEQCYKTETAKETHTTDDEKEDKDTELNKVKEDTGSEVNRTFHQMSPEPNINEPQSSGLFKAVAVHALKALSSNDRMTESQLGRI